jgi:hypothetical protein
MRIGTLNYYREIEGDRQDRLEGVRQLVIDPLQESFRIPPKDVGKLTAANVAIRGGYVEVGAGASFVSASRVENTFVFCVSEEVGMTTFGASHYVITHPTPFGHEICRALTRAGYVAEQWTLRAVRYSSEKVMRVRSPAGLEAMPADFLQVGGLDQYFTKPPSYRLEAEWRYVFWTVQPCDLNFLDVQCEVPVIRALCEFPMAWGQ